MFKTGRDNCLLLSDVKQYIVSVYLLDMEEDGGEKVNIKQSRRD